MYVDEAKNAGNWSVWGISGFSSDGSTVCCEAELLYQYGNNTQGIQDWYSTPNQFISWFNDPTKYQTQQLLVGTYEPDFDNTIRTEVSDVQ